MEVLNFTTRKYQEFRDFYDWTCTFADPRTQDWLLVGSPIGTATLIILYLLIVWRGPIFMQNRKPLELKWPMIVYNLGISFLNLYIGSELLYLAVKLNYNWQCQPVNRSDSPLELRVAKALWWYYFSKCLEFADTIFFILRKKNNQLSFLHVYHHSTMFFFWWIGLKWVPGGSVFQGAMINSFIHVLMYTYYGLAAMGPSIQKFLWWKKYLTMIQLVQFMVAIVQGYISLRLKCDFPIWMKYTLIGYMVSFILLFGNFYLHAYTKKKYTEWDKKKKGKLSEQSNGHVKASMNGHHKPIRNGSVEKKSISSIELEGSRLGALRLRPV